MDKLQLIRYLEGIDRHLLEEAELLVYGSAAFMLMDEVGRTSLDIDVAGPYSRADMGDMRQAAEKAGLSINPDEEVSRDHIEWIAVTRLCLSRPDPATEILLWQGRRLIVRTVSPAQLIASKLIRYDEVDQSDIRFLCFQQKLTFVAITDAVQTLPPQFRDDAMLQENLLNLQQDMELWKGVQR